MDKKSLLCNDCINFINERECRIKGKGDFSYSSCEMLIYGKYKKTMYFGEALEMLKLDKKVAREYWVNNGVYIKLEDVGMTNKEIVMYRRGEKFILNLSNDSIMANDWVILE